MFKFKYIFSSAILLLCGLTTALQASTDIASGIDIHAIRSLKFEHQETGYIAHVEVVFSNTNNRTVRMENGEFEVFIGSKESKGNHIRLGVGKLDGQQIQSNGKTTYKFVMEVGPDNSQTRNNLIGIFNIIGVPANQTPVMFLKGICDFGVMMERGWVTQHSVSVDFQFVPRLQNEVLFQ